MGKADRIEKAGTDGADVGQALPPANRGLDQTLAGESACPTIFHEASRAEGPSQQTGYNRTLKLAIIGYGNVGRALARLLREKRQEFPFTITGIHTLRHGTAADAGGVPAKVRAGAAGHGGGELDVEGGDRDDGAGGELRCGPGGGAEDGDHGGRWGVRRGGLGLGGENGGAGQRADGRADHAATGDDTRHYAVDAGAHDGDRARRQDGAAGEPGTANQRRRPAARARRGAGAERHSGVHAGDQQPDSVPYGFDGYVRNGLDRAWGGTDLSLIHISEPTRLGMNSYAVFCLKKKTQE